MKQHGLAQNKISVCSFCCYSFCIIIFIVIPTLNIFSEKVSRVLRYWFLRTMVSEILRRVTIAVTKAGKTKLKSLKYVFYCSGRKETDERKQADFVSVREELAGLPLGSGHT